MSSLKRNLFLSVFGAAMSATVAFAADLPTPPVIEYEPETVVEIGSGWYLRGDLGYAMYGDGKGHWVNHATSTRVNFYDEKIYDGWLYGVGLGYYFNQHLRADITLDYRNDIKFKAKAPCVGACTPTTERNKFSAWTLMLNGYYDFGTWSAITPYVGAGAGVAYIKTGTHDASSGFDFVGGNETNFAWNLMAGAAVDVADNVKIDANYRYLNMGNTKTKGRTTGGVATNPVKYEDLYAHEFRVGLRYDLN